MYACINETGGGFFEGVCAPSNATANSYDPPHPSARKNRSPANGTPARRGSRRRHDTQSDGEAAEPGHRAPAMRRRVTVGEQQWQEHQDQAEPGGPDPLPEPGRFRSPWESAEIGEERIDCVLVCGVHEHLPSCLWKGGRSWARPSRAAMVQGPCTHVGTRKGRSPATGAPTSLLTISVAMCPRRPRRKRGGPFVRRWRTRIAASSSTRTI